MSDSPSAAPTAGRVALVSLGCARNDVDSEELAGRLSGDGWQLVDSAEDSPDVVLVNTCGFIEQAKQESIDTMLGAAQTGAKVVAVGCMAQRYGAELASSMPEAAAVLSFDDYTEIGDRLRSVVAGEQLTAHTPHDRRELLPITPVRRSSHRVALPGHGQASTGRHGSSVIADLPSGVAPPSGPRVFRHRLAGGPVASLKLASGCDRRCSFCAIPSFRGAFVSRDPQEVLAEATWLAEQGVRELVLVSENSTSYGKDLGDRGALEKLLRQLAAVSGIVRVRLSYLQPAEMRPTLIEALTTTPHVAPYFDLSFQHASPSVLRRMRRFGNTESFWELLASVRQLAPTAGARSNFIVGFPTELRADVAELERFLTEARLDAIGLFAYSDEDGTEAAGLGQKVRPDTRRRRFARLSALAEELTAQRALERIGEEVDVIVESVADGQAEGRAAHQAPEVDGSVTLRNVVAGGPGSCPGDFVRATVVDSCGVDLIADTPQLLSPATASADPR